MIAASAASGHRRAGRGGVPPARDSGSSPRSALAVVFFSIRATNFLTVGNWQDIATDVAIVVVVAVGETMVVLTRNIDLSVGSIVGLTAYLVATRSRITTAPRSR